MIREARQKFVEKDLKKFLDFYVRHLKENGGKFLCGNAPTIADLHVLPQLTRFVSGDIDHVPADCLSSHPEIVEYIARMQALPAIKTWYAVKGH